MIPIFSRSFADSELSTQLRVAFDSVISGKTLVMGEALKSFEAAFAGFIGASHAVGVGNGTDALELALRSCGVGPGDYVATQANSGFYTTTAALNLGAIPVFFDVQESSGAPSLEQVSKALASYPIKALVITHIFGQLNQDIEPIAKKCKESGVALVEDCAQAHGARRHGRSAGSFGDLSTFSFYPTKNLGALGDGGAVLTGDTKLWERVKLLRQYGWSEKYTSEEIGRNSRLDEMQAAFLLVELGNLEKYNLRRREIAASYSAGIIEKPDLLRKLEFAGDESYVAHLYPIKVDPIHRNHFREHLAEHDIATAIHFPIPDHMQPAMTKKHFEVAGDLSNTEVLATSVVSLPLFPQMTEAQVGRVVSVVNSWSPK